MTPPAPAAFSQAAYMLEQAVRRSKATSSLELPQGFVRSEKAADVPPVTQMIRGGRGGEVRLKLYLTMMLIAVGKSPMHKNVPASSWAEALYLKDPHGLGARRISDALQWLENNQFIKLESRRGSPAVITVLSALGDGVLLEQSEGTSLSVPIGLWENHGILGLSGTGLALLLILLDLQSDGTESNPPSLPHPLRRRYGLSDDTWTRAGRELQDLDLLRTTKQIRADGFERRRARNTYWIDISAFNRPMHLTQRHGKVVT